MNRSKLLQGLGKQLVTILLLAGWIGGTGAFGQERQKCLFVLDASNSMSGYKKGDLKMGIAKEVIAELVTTMPDNIDLGLVVYGHRRKSDCDDIELLIEPGPVDRNAFIQTVNGIRPRGKTPLTNAIEFAANSLSGVSGGASIILLTDGLETCRRDPCEAVAALAASGIQLTTHVIAFDLSADQASQIECIATQTGGQFLAAEDAGSLSRALNTAISFVAAGPAEQTALVQEQAPAPLPAAADASQPELKPIIEEYPVALTIPVTVPAGADFQVGWEGPTGTGDFITIVPDGWDERRWMNHSYTGEDNPLWLTALIDPQEAEVRYVSGETKNILGRASITITETEATVSGPAEAVQGNTIKVEWTGPANEGDFITIVPKDTGPGKYKDFEYAKTGKPVVNIRGLIEIGPGEIRYITGQGRRTLARADINFTEALVTLAASKDAVAGSSVSVDWKGPANEGDFITIVPASTEEGKYLKYAYAKPGENPVKIPAPMKVGEAEVRYIAGNGRETMARISMNILEADVTLAAQDEAVAGSSVKIEWKGPANQGDFITIVPVSTEEGKYLKYAYAKPAENLVEVAAPMKAGESEIRYIAGNGRKTLARIPIHVVEADVSLAAPNEAVAGSSVSIEWEGPANQGDFITIVPVSTEEGKYLKYAYTNPDEKRIKVIAPMESGDAEIRYLSGNGRKTLARVPITITEAQITLSAPAEAIAGSNLKLEYDAPGNQGDFITLVAKDADERTYSKAIYAKPGNHIEDVPIPMNLGEMEIRYLAGADRRTLARHTVEVIAAKVELEATNEATVGNKIQVEWSGPGNKGDLITLVNQSAAEGFYKSPVLAVKGKTSVELLAPMEPGEMEIRYVAGANKETLARIPLTLLEARVGLEPPDTAAINQNILIHWTGPQNDNDFLTIVPTDSPDNQQGPLGYTNQGSPATVRAPREAGQYEVRYISGQGRQVLGRAAIEIVSGQ